MYIFGTVCTDLITGRFLEMNYFANRVNWLELCDIAAAKEDLIITIFISLNHPFDI